MAGKTASSVLRATPAEISDRLSSLIRWKTRRRMSRHPARGISLGVRAARPRPGSLRSASSGDVGCGSRLRTRQAEQPLFPPPSAMVAEDERGGESGRSRLLLAARHRFGDEMMVRRERADRIGIGRIAGQEVSLAAAAAEVPPALRTAAAGLLHPALAAVAVEGG